MWSAFFLSNLVINGTIPFALGADMHAWKDSSVSNILFEFMQYGVMFTVVPLIIIKGWETVRQPAFLIPLWVAVIPIPFALIFRGVKAIAVLFLTYLHRSFDFSGDGIRSHDWKGDVLAIVLVGVLYASPSLMTVSSSSFDFVGAFTAWPDRAFANPASTVENLFYFGFLTERLWPKMGRWLTPILIGAMYAAHEMTNPKYWYEGMNFAMAFVGVTLTALIYLWHRSVISIWLGDGFGRFVSKLF